jgi:hypothetical protein
MKRTLQRTITITLATTILFFATGAPSCSESSTYKKAAQALYDIDLGVAGTQAVVEQLNKSVPPILSNEDYLFILEQERSLLLANKTFREELIKAGVVDSSNKDAFITHLTGIANILDTLQAQGVVRIKDPAIKTRYALAITSIRTAAATLTIFLANAKDPINVPTTLLKKGK